MGQVLQFSGMRQAMQPNWMPNPDSWMWQRPQGGMQGFGATWRDHVGLSNLQWLALDLERPPALFDARNNNLYMLLLMYGSPTSGTLAHLVELAELNPLSVFRRKLEAQPHLADVPRHHLAPLLIHLACRRLYRANA